MTDQPEYKVGDILTIKVPVIQGNKGPIIDISLAPLYNKNLNCILVPGHPNYLNVGPSAMLNLVLVTSVETPIREGDRVLVINRHPSKYNLNRSATVMVQLSDDIFMVQYDRYKNYWYRKHRSDLTKAV